jgi:hypothetical protein
MMEAVQCRNTAKIVDYIHQGGKDLGGRMCVEEFNHEACTILKDAIGIKQINSDLPFVQTSINAFKYSDVPVSFVETYAGEFDEVFATRENGEVVGFIKVMGKGKLLMLGAAFPADTLEDLDIVHQMR